MISGPWISLMTPGSNPKEVIARRALVLGCIHFAGLKWQRNPACSFPAHPTSVCPRVSLCCRGRRSWDQTCTVLLPLLCFVLPVSLGAGWRRERSWPKFSSKAWGKADHGLSADSGQPSFFMASADPGIGTLLMNTEPIWTHLFCRCKM